MASTPRRHAQPKAARSVDCPRDNIRIRSSHRSEVMPRQRMPPTDSRALASTSTGGHAAGDLPSRPASRILTACVMHGLRRLEHANSTQRSFEKKQRMGRSPRPRGARRRCRAGRHPGRHAGCERLGRRRVGAGVRRAGRGAPFQFLSRQGLLACSVSMYRAYTRVERPRRDQESGRKSKWTPLRALMIRGGAFPL